MDKDVLKSFEAQVERSIDQLLYALSPRETTPFFPAHVHIEPTNACNLRCIHCHHHPGSRKTGKFTRPLGMMDFRLYSRVIEEIAQRKCAITLNCQGEPTLHKEIVSMISLAKMKGLRVSLLTNATVLDEGLTKEILSSGLDRIVFSFDAIDKELYESIRIGGDFTRTFGNVNRFIELNEQAGHPVFICMSIIVQNKTRDHITAYRQYFEPLPIDTIFESTLLNLSGNTGADDEFNVSRSGDAENHPICRVPWENLVINWDGFVTVCPLDFGGKWIAGDANTESLEDIWNNERYRAFRNAHLSRSYESLEGNGALCSECSCLQDPEYDLRNYAEYVKRALVRSARQLV